MPPPLYVNDKLQIEQTKDLPPTIDKRWKPESFEFSLKNCDDSKTFNVKLLPINGVCIYPLQFIILNLRYSIILF